MTAVRGSTAAQNAAKKATTKPTTPKFEFELGAMVAVNLTGRVVGRSEFEEGGPSYLIEHERKGKLVREWIVGDKLVGV